MLMNTVTANSEIMKQNSEIMKKALIRFEKERDAKNYGTGTSFSYTKFGPSTSVNPMFVFTFIRFRNMRKSLSENQFSKN
jgi:hypothetical protein